VIRPGKVRWHERPFPQRWEVVLWLIFIVLAASFWVLRWLMR
jgi:hypothetical protein